MIEYLKLENVADERGEEPAKVARTLVRLGYDLYLRFGPSRDSRSGVSFYPEHPTERMEHNIGSGDKQLTKDSQEAVIKRLGRGDTTTEGLTVLDVSPNEVSQKLVLSCDEIVELDPKPEVLKFQIELMEQDDSVCVVVIPDDVAKLPPPLLKWEMGSLRQKVKHPQKIILKFFRKKQILKFTKYFGELSFFYEKNLIVHLNIKKFGRLFVMMLKNQI